MPDQALLSYHVPFYSLTESQVDVYQIVTQVDIKPYFSSLNADSGAHNWPSDILVCIICPNLRNMHMKSASGTRCAGYASTDTCQDSRA